MRTIELCSQYNRMMHQVSSFFCPDHIIEDKNIYSSKIEAVWKTENVQKNH